MTSGRPTRSRTAERPGDEHIEEFEVRPAEGLSPEILGLERPYRKVVRIERPDRTKALETCLVETDPTNTDIVVAAAHTPPAAGTYGDPQQVAVVVANAGPPDLADPPLGRADLELMTAVVHKSEVAGKPVKPVVILADDPEMAQLRAVRDIGAEELLIDPADGESPDARLDRLAGHWREISGGARAPLTIRLIAQDREERRDLDGGSRIPRAADGDGEMARALAGVTVD